MQQRLLTEANGFLFLLLVAGFGFRSVWRQSKRRGPMAVWKRTSGSARRYLVRLGVTIVVAWIIAVIVVDDGEQLVWVWVVLWVGIYWLWKLWDRWRGKGGVASADEPTATAMVVPVAQVPDGSTQWPLWRRVVRKALTLASVAVAFIVVMVGVMILCLGYYERQARSERDKVQVGMTVDEVLSLVRGACGIRTHAVLPDNVSDEEGVHFASLVQHKDGTFGWYGAPDKQSRQLTEDEARELMKRKMSDGYEWRWRYTFINDTPQHFSFTVTFGPDGRVKDVTDVWGWD